MIAAEKQYNELHHKCGPVDATETQSVDIMVNWLVKSYLNYGVSKEDLRQSGWQGYLTGRQTFDCENGCPFYIWSIQNIVWEMCRQLTMESRHRHYQLNEGISSKGSNIEEAVVDRLSVEESIAKLSDKQQKFLEFRFGFGLTSVQTAARLGVSQGLCSSLERQTLATLRAILSPTGERRYDLIPSLKGGRLAED